MKIKKILLIKDSVFLQLALCWGQYQVLENVFFCKLDF